MGRLSEQLLDEAHEAVASRAEVGDGLLHGGSPRNDDFAWCEAMTAAPGRFSHRAAIAMKWRTRRVAKSGQPLNSHSKLSKHSTF